MAYLAYSIYNKYTAISSNSNSITSESMDTSKGSERVNEEGAVEIKVDTVDYRSPAGENQEPKKEDVEITHVIPQDKPQTFVSKAVDKVGETIQSAKQAIGGTQKTE